MQTTPAVILVRPSEEGNVGAAARAMANTGFSELILVEPAAAIGSTARAFAVGAGGILDGAQYSSSFAEATAPFQFLVGTASQRGRAPQVPVLTLRELPARLADEPVSRTALVFGPERSGLTTEELARCHLLVQIPAAPEQPTYNLAQAVLLVTHELYLASLEPMATQEAPAAATIGEVDGLLKHLHEMLEEVGFDRDDTFAATFRDLRRLANRARLTPREVALLRGILRRAGHALERAQ